MLGLGDKRFVRFLWHQASPCCAEKLRWEKVQTWVYGSAPPLLHSVAHGTCPKHICKVRGYNWTAFKHKLLNLQNGINTWCCFTEHLPIPTLLSLFIYLRGWKAEHLPSQTPLQLGVTKSLWPTQKSDGDFWNSPPAFLYLEHKHIGWNCNGHLVTMRIRPRDSYRTWPQYLWATGPSQQLPTSRLLVSWVIQNLSFFKPQFTQFF